MNDFNEPFVDEEIEKLVIDNISDNNVKKNKK